MTDRTKAMDNLIAQDADLIETQAREIERLRGVLGWIERQSSLHQQVDILYVVDGFSVSLIRDGSAQSNSFHGESLLDAVLNARAAFGDSHDQ